VTSDHGRTERCLEAVRARRGPGARVLVAIAGPPASGKSTLAADLVARLSGEGLTAALVPMDGFHLDNAVLDARGLLHRKGAPETFDAAGFCHLIGRLRDRVEAVVPRFDRALDLAIAGAEVVGADCDVVVVEGNYLLFAEAPWDTLAPMWDVRIFLEVPERELRPRLVRRWLDHGLTESEAAARAEANDLANARRIMAARLGADLTL
jgi:fructokinase